MTSNACHRRTVPGTLQGTEAGRGAEDIPLPVQDELVHPREAQEVDARVAPLLPPLG